MCNPFAESPANETANFSGFIGPFSEEDFGHAMYAIFHEIAVLGLVASMWPKQVL
jgi:hypothetical protein